MTSLPLTETGYAKVNLALHVRARRADGYHDLESLFVFLADGDVLTATADSGLNLSITGPFAVGLTADADNLVLRAALALQRATGHGGGARLVLDKRLPVAAGIGGGSADAAAALRLLVRLWGLSLSHDDLEAIAAPLGADVPACIRSASVMARGIGQHLTPVDPGGLSARPILLVNPAVPCPTGPVFAGWDGVDRGPLAAGEWMAARNDLAPSAIALVPSIAAVLDWLAGHTQARVTRMSGSGATCFALFENTDARDAAAQEIATLQPQWWALASRIR